MPNVGNWNLRGNCLTICLKKNVVAWSAMIFGYTQNNQSDEALTLFKEMVGKSNQEPNEITILAALSACAHLVI